MDSILDMMKKLLYSFIALFCLCSCGTDLSEIEDRLDQLEQEENNQKKKKQELEKEINDLDNQNDQTNKDIDELEKEMNKPQLYSFDILAIDNPMQLVENVKGEIEGDSIINCWIVNITSDKKLIPRFEFKGESVSIDGKKVDSGVTVCDFSKPAKLTVSNAGQTKSYVIYVQSYTGLPVLWTETNKREDISTTTKYYNASFKLVEGTKTRAAGDITEAKVKIRAVGEVKWYQSAVHDSYQMGKNSYTIVFPSNVSLMNDPLNNDWDLRPNADDNTMLRNQTAYYMGKISNLDYTPRFHFVDLMLNGRYYGTYMLGDHIENNANRVDVGFSGFILKIGTNASGVTFRTSKLEQPVTIVSPSTSAGDAYYQEITQYMSKAENALFGSNFTDADEGWQKYLDMDSFVDWYLINEIAKNDDGAFVTDCFMSLKQNGKLKMGPLWTFEKAFGNSKDNSPRGFVIKNTKWFSRLFEDPAFVEKVKERFSYFYDHQTDIVNEINANGEYLKYSAQENNHKWGVFDAYKKTGFTPGALYLNEVQSMKEWLSRRMEWLKSEL